MDSQEMTIPVLRDMVFDYSDPMAEKIKQSIEKYKVLGMTSMVKTAYQGAAAYVLSRFNMNLIYRVGTWKTFTEPNISWLYLIKPNGEKTELIAGRHGYHELCWERCLLKDFNRPIPFDILEKIPKDWGDKATVFYPEEAAEDPIIAVNIGEESKRIMETQRRSFWSTKVDVISVAYPGSGYYAAVFRWE